MCCGDTAKNTNFSIGIPYRKAARIFNSAVASHNGGFVGVFRADQKNGRATLFSGSSSDGLAWNIGPDPIQWVDETAPESDELRLRSEAGSDRRHFLYRLVLTTCTVLRSVWGGRKIFRTFIRMSNPLMPVQQERSPFPAERLTENTCY